MLFPIATGTADTLGYLTTHLDHPNHNKMKNTSWWRPEFVSDPDPERGQMISFLKLILLVLTSILNCWNPSKTSWETAIWILFTSEIYYSFLLQNSILKPVQTQIFILKYFSSHFSVDGSNKSWDIPKHPQYP